MNRILVFISRMRRNSQIRELLRKREWLQQRASELFHEHSLVCMSGYYAGIPSEQRPKIAEREMKEIQKIEKELTNLGWNNEKSEH